MQCPTDGATLMMSERSGIEIDYCPDCRGIWLDRGELDKLIERSYEQPGFEPQAPQQPYGQHAPHGQQPPYGQPGYGQGSGGGDTVGRLADKALRMVQQRASGQRGRGYDQRGYDQRGGRNWLSDILR